MVESHEYALEGKFAWAKKGKTLHFGLCNAGMLRKRAKIGKFFDNCLKTILFGV